MGGAAVRLFIAIPVDDSGRNILVSAMKSMSTTADAVKWVHPGNLHLSLVFLGEIEENRVPVITERVRHATENQPSFTLSFTGISHFGPAAHPKVIFSPVTGDTGTVRHLQERIVTSLSGIYQPDRRPYTPHITLGRGKKGCRVSGDAYSAAGQSVQGTFDVRTCILYKSVLQKEGPVYTEIHSFPLCVA